MTTWFVTRHPGAVERDAGKRVRHRVGVQLGEVTLCIGVPVQRAVTVIGKEALAGRQGRHGHIVDATRAAAETRADPPAGEACQLRVGPRAGVEQHAYAGIRQQAEEARRALASEADGVESSAHWPSSPTV